MSYIQADGVAEHMVRFFSPVHALSRDNSKLRRVGVYTGPTEKELYVTELQHRLQTGTLRRAEQLVGGNPENDWSELLTQLGSFRRTIRPPHEPAFSKYAVSFSGKGTGAKDDLAMALQIALHWSKDDLRIPRL